MKPQSLSHSMVVGLVVIGGAAAASFADTLNVPADYPSIQAAIEAAAVGDEVVVAPGTYFELIDLLGKAITVRSA